MNDDVDVTLLASDDKGRIEMTRGIDKITSSTFDNLFNDIRTMVDRTRRIERWSIRSLEKRIDSMLFERTAIAHKPELSWLESDVGSTTQKKHSYDMRHQKTVIWPMEEKAKEFLGEILGGGGEKVRRTKHNSSENVRTKFGESLEITGKRSLRRQMLLTLEQNNHVVHLHEMVLKKVIDLGKYLPQYLLDIESFHLVHEKIWQMLKKVTRKDKIFGNNEINVNRWHTRSVHYVS